MVIDYIFYDYVMFIVKFDGFNKIVNNLVVKFYIVLINLTYKLSNFTFLIKFYSDVNLVIIFGLIYSVFDIQTVKIDVFNKLLTC